MEYRERDEADRRCNLRLMYTTRKVTRLSQSIDVAVSIIIEIIIYKFVTATTCPVYPVILYKYYCTLQACRLYLVAYHTEH